MLFRSKDIPIVLNSVSQEIDYQGNFDSVRYCYWTLNFTMKTWFYGPVRDTKYIRTVYTNVWEGGSQYGFSQDYCGYSSRVLVANVSGTFKKQDTVYQGRSLKESTGQGIVLNYSANTTNTGELLIGSVQGTFSVNNTIHAVSTNAQCNIASYYTPPTKAFTVITRPDPINALAGQDYGYYIDVVESPEIANT